jgi:hypothetical protein
MKRAVEVKIKRGNPFMGGFERHLEIVRNAQ